MILRRLVWCVVDSLRSWWCGHPDRIWEKDGTIVYQRCVRCRLRTTGTDFGPPPVFVKPDPKTPGKVLDFDQRRRA